MVAVGGGVAEMLVSLLAYARGASVDARWAVIGGNERFFDLLLVIDVDHNTAEMAGFSLFALYYPAARANPLA